MSAWWGRTVIRARWLILALAAGLVVGGLTWGLGVFRVLSNGGFDDPASESSRATQRIHDAFGQQGPDIVVIYTSATSTVDDPAVAAAITGTVARLRQHPEVASVRSYYDTREPEQVSTDRRSTFVEIMLRATDEPDKLAGLDAVTPTLAAPGLHADIGGLVPFIRDANRQVEQDVQRAELLSLPVLLILLVVIFRGLVAAALPLVIGVLAILGAFMATRALATVTEVSTFAVNIITMLGLGMAIDYALFMVSRFREELTAGRDTASAVAATLVTAGRTVLISGLTVALSLASLLIFPFGFLRSMGWGGMAAILVAMLAAVTVLPALLAVLGPRVNALRLGRRRRSAARTAGGAAGEGGLWAHLAYSVMRRPIRYAAAVLIVLAVLAAPFLRVEFGGFDERVLPAGTQSRTVTERLAADFSRRSAAPIAVVVTNGGPAGAQELADRIRRLPNVVHAAVRAEQGDAALVSVDYAGPPTGELARGVVSAIRALPAPPGAEVLVGGRPAAELDELSVLSHRLPWMALLVGVVTMLVLFLAFGSVVLPVKAILMNVISISASFGVVVWAFQDGHLADLLDFTSTGFLEPTNLVLMLAVLFGLSTDYEVFLLSRVREEWDRAGDNARAVATGLQRTGGIITAAALLLVIVVGGFAAGGTASIKLLGVGAVVAIVVDAVLVRALLVPATMQLLGRWNWWAPGPLARVYRRYGLREAGEPAAPTRSPTPVG